MGLAAMILVFWMLSFKPAFSFSSFTFLKRLFSFSSLSAIRVVSSAYLRLLMFLPAILIPALVHPAQHFTWCTLHISWISRWVFLVVLWLRLHLSMQGVWVWFLVGDPSQKNKTLKKWNSIITNPIKIFGEKRKKRRKGRDTTILSLCVHSEKKSHEHSEIMATYKSGRDPHWNPTILTP